MAVFLRPLASHGPDGRPPFSPGTGLPHPCTDAQGRPRAPPRRTSARAPPSQWLPCSQPPGPRGCVRCSPESRTSLWAWSGYGIKRAYNRCCIQFSALTATWRYGAMADGEDSMAVTLRRRRFTLDEYHRMGETGILGPDDRVELIEGEIIEMSPIGSRHAATLARVHHLFSRRLDDRAVVWSQNPLPLVQPPSDTEPDVMLR